MRAWLVHGNALLLILLLSVCAIFAVRMLYWPGAIILAGLALLVAPPLFQATPAGWRGGRSALLLQAVLTAAVTLGLALWVVS